MVDHSKTGSFGFRTKIEHSKTGHLISLKHSKTGHIFVRILINDVRLSNLHSITGIQPYNIRIAKLDRFIKLSSLAVQILDVRFY
jgi:hypothetical protein